MVSDVELLDALLGFGRVMCALLDHSDGLTAVSLYADVEDGTPYAKATAFVGDSEVLSRSVFPDGIGDDE